MSKGKKKFNAGHPIFAQLMALVPDEVFNKTIKQTQADRYYKKMKARDHFICLFYGVLTSNSSLRAVCKNIALLGRKLISIGLKQLPNKSTLSDANRRRDFSFLPLCIWVCTAIIKPFLKPIG